MVASLVGKRMALTPPPLAGPVWVLSRKKGEMKADIMPAICTLYG